MQDEESLHWPKNIWKNGDNRLSWTWRRKHWNREIKIHVYRKRQNSDSSWEFLRIENKQIKTVQHDSYG